MRRGSRKKSVAAKKNGTTNHTLAKVYLIDTHGISDVIEVKSIQSRDASSSNVTGWVRREVDLSPFNARTRKRKMNEKSIIMGSTGIESSMPGSRALLTAKGVRNAMRRKPVSRRTTKSHTTSNASGTRPMVASPLNHSA